MPGWPSKRHSEARPGLLIVHSSNTRSESVCCVHPGPLGALGMYLIILVSGTKVNP
jgi:hypothetical protein